jgi:WhiB family redox-sensing transcriptional regulator
VKEQCLEYALVNRIDHGVWGGASERERRRILKRRRDAVAAASAAADDLEPVAADT